MTWKMFLDDERYPVDDNWVIVRNKCEVLKAISDRGMPSFISFDHDLGENEPTGYDIVKALVELDMDGEHKFPEGFSWYVHSQNPVGALNIDSYLSNYYKLFR